MNPSKNQILKAAQSEHNKAKQFSSEISKKQQSIKQLQDEINKDYKKAKSAGVFGAAGAIVGAGQKSHAHALEQKVKQLEHDVHSLEEKVKFAQREASRWEEKAKFAEN